MMHRTHALALDAIRRRRRRTTEDLEQGLLLLIGRQLHIKERLRGELDPHERTLLLVVMKVYQQLIDQRQRDLNARK